MLRVNDGHKHQTVTTVTTHQSPAEMCWLSVPAATAGSVLTNVDVIHQSVTVQETFPCSGEEPIRKTADLTFNSTYLFENHYVISKLTNAGHQSKVINNEGDDTNVIIYSLPTSFLKQLHFCCYTGQYIYI